MILTIHRGARQVGGSCVELATRSSRLLLDVGQPLEEPSTPGKHARTDGLVARVCQSSPRPDGVLLSHAHGDHSGLAGEVPSDVPFFLSCGTSKMLLLGGCYAGQKGIGRKRQKTFTFQKPFRIGDFSVMAHPVDHSACGSSAFLIEADGRRVLYSGDLRWHGRKPGMARALIQASRAGLLDALVMEGTHFSTGRVPGGTEAGLERQVFDDIKAAPGLVCAAFSPVHLDRLVTFYRATRRAGRTFVLDHYGASVLRFVASEIKVPPPEPRHGIRVFFPKRRKVIAKLESPLQSARITLAEILENPRQFVLLFRPSMLEGDFAAALPSRMTCLYSYWPGYLDKPEWQTTQARISEAGGKLLQRHVSGHIYADDLVKLVRALSPRVVIPIHTERPEVFREHFPNALLLADGERHEVG